MPAEWTAGRGATVRRGDAAAAGRSGQQQEDFGVAAGTAGHGTTARKGGTTKERGSV